MAYLIDGYNLLHNTDVFGRGALAGTLQGAREALLELLATTLTERQRQGTTIVFDAAGAPPGLPDAYEHSAMQVRYARDFPDADALLEELIEIERAPRGLTVVSSDHRVQRAARRRGAAWIDSDVWIREVRKENSKNIAKMQGRTGSAGVGDSATWSALFNDAPTRAAIEAAEKEPLPKAPQQRSKALLPPSPGPPALPKPQTEPQASRRSKKRRDQGELGPKNAEPRQPFGHGIFEGFPPGYAEDLLEPGADGDGSDGRNG